jgi:hypothetical protein
MALSASCGLQSPTKTPEWMPIRLVGSVDDALTAAFVLTGPPLARFKLRGDTLKGCKAVLQDNFTARTMLIVCQDKL